ncbi:polysaccharide deacetylase family protein [Corynebacterium sp. A21]|uniref:polysaccharide deacetylase family protein n=1 Tax=Corynebacterium sp. A21 TaxID=3457318 RepID=UPI003FD5B529
MPRISSFMRGALTPVADRFGGSGIVLAYHDIIGDEDTPYQYAVRVSTFREQLKLVQQLGYRFIHFSELTDRLLRGDSVAGTAAILFDDALIGVYRNAMPHLLGQGLPWTLLPVTARLGVKPPWWEPAERTMDLGEIRESVAAGAQLCGHTATHLSLPELTPAQVAAELLRSREQLSIWGGRDVRELCYPFGHQNAWVREQVRSAGYRSGWTFTNGRCHPGDDPFTLRRMAMTEELSGVSWAKSLLRPRWTWPAPPDTSATGGRS